MSRVLVALLVVLSSLFSVSLSSSFYGAAGSAGREFDYFLLSLQWPGTFCQRTRHCCPTNGCCMSSVNLQDFTIHGLWPNYNDGTWPACCTNTRFDLTKVTSLLGKLSKYWPSLSCSSSSNCHGGKGLFWAHEFEKHGTCSSPVIQDEFDYFSTTLDLYFKYNMTKVLVDAGFFSNNSEKYKTSDISAAIRNSTGATPWLVCSRDSVQELRICFHKDFTLRDCGVISGAENARDSCPQYIRLPEYTRSANVDFLKSSKEEALSSL